MPILLLDGRIAYKHYCHIDLSVHNPELKTFSISDASQCQRYIDLVLERKGCKVAYGGYLERRNLYSKSERFSEGNMRDIHLGMDFWCKAGTEVIAPLDGVVHSFNNNLDNGNYGPTLILEHSIASVTFYTLYGHLSLKSLSLYKNGKLFKKGAVLGWLGTPDVNVGYAPHLHFQIIINLHEFRGDYPGVCAEKDLELYKSNCPDPNHLLQL
ncbi:peptidoglycan DD-metalloendopeptidase family protein [Allomuricauda sp. d1]|uniref:peptidoglycan DD-metalloendopeptidase family protein n=1 Tax=Allomuricauda sp. d1 TaxID=3136725 RepID=UPI0031DE8471